MFLQLRVDCFILLAHNQLSWYCERLHAIRPVLASALSRPCMKRAVVRTEDIFHGHLESLCAGRVEEAFAREPFCPLACGVRNRHVCAGGIVHGLTSQRRRRDQHRACQVRRSLRSNHHDGLAAHRVSYKHHGRGRKVGKQIADVRDHRGHGVALERGCLSKSGHVCGDDTVSFAQLRHNTVPLAMRTAKKVQEQKDRGRFERAMIVERKHKRWMLSCQALTRAVFAVFAARNISARARTAVTTSMQWCAVHDHSQRSRRTQLAEKRVYLAR